MIAKLGIQSANTRSVQEAASALPNMRSTLSGWFRKLELTLVVKQTVDHQIVEVEKPLETQGVIQPLGKRELENKPEGQRAWQWFLLHTVSDLALKPDDVVGYRGARYRVMSSGAWQEYGYFGYELVQAFTHGSR